MYLYKLKEQVQSSKLLSSLMQEENIWYLLKMSMLLLQKSFI